MSQRPLVSVLVRMGLSARSFALATATRYRLEWKPTLIEFSRQVPAMLAA